MKAIELLEPIDKASLLFDLFTEELPQWLDFSQALIQSISVNPAAQMYAPFKILSPSRWLMQVAAMHDQLLWWNRNSRRSSRDMIRHLFNESIAPYSIVCLQQYIQQDNFHHPAFAYVVRGLFSEHDSHEMLS